MCLSSTHRQVDPPGAIDDKATTDQADLKDARNYVTSLSDQRRHATQADDSHRHAAYGYSVEYAE
jgi:hypothetical protein